MGSPAMNLIEGTLVDQLRYDFKIDHRQKLWDSWDLTVRGQDGDYPSWLEIRLRTEGAVLEQGRYHRH